MSKPPEPRPLDDDSTPIEASAQAGASARVDAVSSATVWHLGRERDPQIPLPGVPYTAADKADGALCDAASAYVASRRHNMAGDVDTATGATPGVASACRELGLSSTSEVARRLGIKPPGVR